MPSTGKLEFNGGRPGERLRLLTVEKDAPPLKARLGFLGAIMVSLVVIAGSLYSATQDIVPFLGLMAAIIAVAALLAGAVVFPSARLLALDCDWGASRLCYHHGLPGYPSDMGLIDFSSIGSVAVEVPPGPPRDTTDLPIRLTVRDLGGGGLLETRLIVSDVDCETKLMDLLMRIGQSIGLAYYHVSVRNPPRLEMHVTRQREDRSKTIPTITKRANYAKDVVAEGIEPPDAWYLLSGKRSGRRRRRLRMILPL